MDRLFELQDLSYREFHSKLMPTVPKEKIIGVRTPVLRNFAKEFRKMPDCELFLSTLPHQYYEEDNLHAFLMEYEKNFETLVEKIETFLPYVDNWATCDGMRPKLFQKHKDELIPYVKKWIASEHVYTVRYGVGMLLSYYLDDAFKPEYLEWAANIKSDEYYVKMMIAWYFATALAKQYDSAICYIEEKKLETWTHSKTIQKAIESYRISPECKNYLRTHRTR